MKTIKDFNLAKKRVLLRCDFNVPLTKKGRIADDFRVRMSLPTIKYLISKKSKVILMSHLDKPGGKVVEKLRLKPVKNSLQRYLKIKIKKTNDCLGKEVKKSVFSLKDGEVLLLENLRFHKEEKKCDLKFAKELSILGDIFINDAFSVCHRNHASITGIPKFLDSGIGFLIEKEINNLDRLTKNPKKPVVAIIGGKKVEDKAGVIKKFLKISNFILINHLIFKELNSKNIFLKSKKIIPPLDGISKAENIYDIGPKTIKLFKKIIEKAKTIFWSGPLGKFEEKPFNKGSLEIAKSIVSNKKAFSVAGGGDTVSFLNKYKLSKYFTHVSTGGSAMLEYIAGEKLLGLEILKKK